MTKYELYAVYNCNCELCSPEITREGTFDSWQAAAEAARRDSAHDEPLSWAADDFDVWRADSGLYATEFEIRILRPIE